MGARIALGLLNKPYWLIDLEADLQRVGDYLEREIPSEGSRATYAKGVRKLAKYLRLICHRPAPERVLNCDYHLAGLPPWLA